MTLLEQLIAQQVRGSAVATLSRTTEKIAEQMAQEILKDPAFRVEMQALIRVAFAQTLRALQQEPPAAPPAGTP